MVTFEWNREKLKALNPTTKNYLKGLYENKQIEKLAFELKIFKEVRITSGCTSCLATPLDEFEDILKQNLLD